MLEFSLSPKLDLAGLPKPLPIRPAVSQRSLAELENRLESSLDASHLPSPPLASRHLDSDYHGTHPGLEQPHARSHAHPRRLRSAEIPLHLRAPPGALHRLAHPALLSRPNLATPQTKLTHPKPPYGTPSPCRISDFQHTCS
ncbi:hypothetical protein BV22DRAFT_1135627 [Leucogyrophana mollusca]|uniref:Uncharacterized protein n=1 Tax=Leucogyrophana mollusca TaxID=85980 RepID=A0ACB8AV81_9AGAM|nr:hypothetical protein BV22DRAFT_1135627 [Leucogyrophana mollusca]